MNRIQQMPWEACDGASGYPEAVGVSITPAEGPLGARVLVATAVCHCLLRPRL